METIMNQLFSPELIPDYMHAHPEYGVKRILIAFYPLQEKRMILLPLI